MPDGEELVNLPTRFQNLMKSSGVISISCPSSFLIFIPIFQFLQGSAWWHCLDQLVCRTFLLFSDLTTSSSDRDLSLVPSVCLLYGSSVYHCESVFILFLYDSLNVCLLCVGWCFPVFDCLNLENCWAAWVFHCSLYEILHSDVVFTIYLVFDSARSFNLIICSGIYETVAQVHFPQTF